MWLKFPPNHILSLWISEEADRMEGCGGPPKKGGSLEER